MIFIETPIFTDDVKALLSDEAYAELQSHLATQPDAGDLIQGTGGLRVIYYHVGASGHIRMILIYRKGIKDDLSQKEKAILRMFNERWN